MKKASFAPWPLFDAEIINAVNGVLQSGKVNQWTGEQVYLFEKEYAGYLGVKHAIALANGSVTLDDALKVLGIGPGDEVVVTSRSFVASASCVALAGALPVFAEVDRESGNITAETIAAVLTKKTKAVLVVHLAGWPCDLDDIVKLCRSKRLFLIEDCAQAHGAKYKGRPVGTFGNFGSFSFCQDKIFSTGGEGGLLVTNDKALWKKAWSLKDHGRNLDAVFKQGGKNGTSFKWMVNSFGTNHRLTEMQAAVGRVMLRRLNKMVHDRRNIAATFNQAFSGLEGLRVTVPPPEIYHAYYKYYVYLERKDSPGLTRDSLLKKLSGLGVPCGCGACPEIYREKAFQKQRRLLGLKPQARWPVAKELGETAVMLLVHPSLNEHSISYVIESFKKILKRGK